MSSTESVALLVRALDALVVEDVAGQPDQSMRDALLALLGAARRLEAEVVRRVGVFDVRGLSVVDGCRSTRSWLRNFGRLSGLAAGELVGGARVLRELPLLARASAGGGLSGEQLRQVGRLVRRVGVEPVRGVQPTLAQAAAQLDGAGFGRVCQRVVVHVDPDGAVPDAGVDFARRGVTLSPFDGMVLVRGQLDPEGGAALLTALDAVLPAPGVGDPRGPAQRRADALVELARGALAGGRLPVVGGVRPQVAVLVTPQQLTDPATAPGEAPPREGVLPSQEVLLTESGSPWLEWVGPVPAALAQRIACDADVWRVVLDPTTGRPTDVGRTHRLVPAWIRKALHARDRACRFPGCQAPAAWTDAHHLRPWARGGPTNIDNLILLCRFHHSLIHESRWTIRLDTDTGHVTATRPDGRPYEIHDHRTRPPTINPRAA